MSDLPPDPPAAIQAVEPLPPLPLEEWEDTKETLHRFLQIVGKVRLAAAPYRNHWWNVPVYVTTRGLTTSPIPDGDSTFAIDLDLLEHRLAITTSAGGAGGFALEGLSVAAFYALLFDALRGLGIEPAIHPRPFDLADTTPFPEDTAHVSYDPEFVHRWWRALLWTDQALKEFAGRFTGKTSPVHLFWHSFDLTVTRFSGRRTPAATLEGADPVTLGAYSHEVISFGFWAGDAKNRFPAFYSYTAPEPEALAAQPLEPEGAWWSDTGRGSLAILRYDDVRTAAEPRTALLAFLQSAYAAGAATAGWDRAELDADGPSE